MKHESGYSQLLNDYRVALINAYSLGEEIKDLYSIVPPKVILEKVREGYEVVIGLTVN